MQPSLTQIWTWLSTLIAPTATPEARRAAGAAIGALDGQRLWALQDHVEWKELTHVLDLPPAPEEAWMSTTLDPDAEVPPPSAVPPVALEANGQILGGWLRWDDTGYACPTGAPLLGATWREHITVCAQVRPQMPMPLAHYGAQLFWGRVDVMEALEWLVMRFEGPTNAMHQIFRELERPDRLHALPAPLALAWQEYAQHDGARWDVVEALAAWVVAEVTKRVSPWLDHEALRDTHAALQVQLGRWCRLLEITDPRFAPLAAQTITALFLRHLSLADMDTLAAVTGEDDTAIHRLVRDMETGEPPEITLHFTRGLIAVRAPVPPSFWEGLSREDREAARFLSLRTHA